MSWWGKGLLDGDTPLRYLDDVEDAIGIHGLFPFEDVTRKKWSKVRKALSDPDKRAAARSAVSTEEPYGHEVLACLFMAAKLSLPADVRANALAAADDDMVQWGVVSEKRRTALAAFVAAVRQHRAGDQFLPARASLQTALKRDLPHAS